MSNPTTLVEQFDGDAGAFTVTGPERYDGGLWLEEGTTNLIANPSAESDTAGMGTDLGSDGALTRSTDRSTDGAASFRLERTGGSYAPGHNLYTSLFVGGAAAGDHYTLSADFSRDVAQPLSSRLALNWYTAGNGYVGEAQSGNQEIGVAFARRSFSVEIPVSDATAAQIFPIMYFTLQDNSASSVGATAYADAIQLEKKTYATSYTVGVRAASSASVPTAGHMAPGSGSLAFRVTPTIETGVEEIWGECGVKGSGTDHLRWGRDASKHPFAEWSSNDAAYQRKTGSETLNAGTAYDVYLGWDGTAMEMAVDAGTVQTGSRAAVSSSFGGGDLVLDASVGGVIYQSFATFDRLLTKHEIARLNAAPAWSLATLAANTQVRHIRQQFQLRPY